MTRKELLKYEQSSVSLEYRNDIGPQQRSGIIYCITQNVVVFWPFEADNELHIKFENIINVRETQR